LLLSDVLSQLILLSTNPIFSTVQW